MIAVLDGKSSMGRLQSMAGTCFACIWLLTGCEKPSRSLDVEIAVRYRDHLVRQILPVECGRRWTEGGEVLTQHPSAGLAARMPDGSVIINSLPSFCAHRLPDDGGWKTSALQYWPIVWMDRPRQPALIESYVSEQYFESAHPRVVPISIKVRLSRGIRSAASFGAHDDYGAVAPFWGETSSAGFRARMKPYCGASVVALSRSGSELDTLIGLKLAPIDIRSLPVAWRTQSPAIYPLFPTQLLDRGGEADAASRLWPLLISPARRADLDVQEHARGFFRLYRLKTRGALTIVSNGKAIVLSDDLLGDPRTGAALIPSTHCDHSLGE